MHIEHLETRRYFALGSGVITINGTEGVDNLQLTQSGSIITLTNLNTGAADVSSGTVTQIIVNLGGGHDFLRLSTAAGTLVVNVAVSVSGGAGNDAIFTGNGNDTLRGQDGNDSLFGGNGADRLSPGGGNDYLDGEAGSDTLDYSPFLLAVQASLDGLNNDGIIGDSTNAADIHNFENILGGAGNDILIGGNSANAIDGGAGNDQIAGRGGNDTLTGGTGNDTIWGEDGADGMFAKDGIADRLNDGPGTDSAQIDSSPADTTTSATPVTPLAFALLLSQEIKLALAEGQSPSDLDELFGVGGISLVDTSFGPTITDVLLQGDKTLLVGSVYGQDFTRDFLLIRLNADGSLDTTFGVGGVTTTDFTTDEFDPRNDDAYAASIDALGRIVVVGATDANFSDTDYALARYSADGVLDTSFGDGVESPLGTEIVQRSFNNDELVDVIAVEEESVISYVVLGHFNSEAVELQRFDEDGVYDGFFTNTWFTMPVGEGDLVPVAMVQDALGNFIIMNDGGPGANSAARFNAFSADGTLLSGGGYITLSDGNLLEFHPTDMAVQGNRLVISGQIYAGEAPSGGALAAATLNYDDGFYVTDIVTEGIFPGASVRFDSVAFDGTARAVATGFFGGSAVAYRFDTDDLSPDQTFSQGLVLAKDVAEWSDVNNATIGSVSMTIIGVVSPGNLQVQTDDFAGSDYVAPLFGASSLQYGANNDWTALFSEPVSDLLLYAKDWRGTYTDGADGTTSYTFDKAFTIVSGFNGATVDGNTLILPDNESFYNGILMFAGPLDNLNVISDGLDTSGQVMTFALGSTLDGMALYNVQDSAAASGVAVQDDGKIVLAGVSYDWSSESSSVFAARLLGGTVPTVAEDELTDEEVEEKINNGELKWYDGDDNETGNLGHYFIYRILNPNLTSSGVLTVFGGETPPTTGPALLALDVTVSSGATDDEFLVARRFDENGNEYFAVGKNDDIQYFGSDELTKIIIDGGAGHTRVIVENALGIPLEIIAEEDNLEVIVKTTPDGAGTPRNVVSHNDPAHGSAAIDDQGTGDTSDDAIEYTPDLDYFGGDQLTYTTSDGGAGTIDITLNSAKEAPIDLALTPAAIDESLPAGTQVGLFSSTDIDSTEFTYELVPGEGDTDNALFDLTPAGVLTSNTVFDFEVKSSYSVRVRTTDETGRSLEKVVTITITDVDEPAKFTGAVIGTNPSAKASSREKAFDGKFNTSFKGASSQSSSAWVGLDLGTAQNVSLIKYAPPAGGEHLMVGGMFQASNDPKFQSGVVTIFTITTEPPSGQLTEQYVTTPGNFRYYRYIGPPGSFGQVAEVEFWGVQDQISPSKPTNVHAGAVTQTSIQILWDASTDNAAVSHYEIYRDGKKIGTTASLSFTSTGLRKNKLYTFAVKAVDTSGNASPLSDLLAVNTLA